MGYKGSWIRRRQVSHKTWCDNWERALGKKKETKRSAPKTVKCPSCGGDDSACGRCGGSGVVAADE